MDDKWGDAISQWIDQGDPKYPGSKQPDPGPLANLMRSGEPIPPEVGEILAEIIDPKFKRISNWKLPPVKWTGALNIFRKEGAKHLNIALTMEDSARKGTPRPTRRLAKQHKVTERWVLEIWRRWRKSWVEVWKMTLHRPHGEHPDQEE
ncbi:MAG: hypothetical protein M3178_16335 [Pseudomonadota bacterium]|nr:hypothetical protein [Pseudomonadota bacterium]